ncbi:MULTISPECIES: hypothetical protein [unclassified Deinococcus]|uniref:hypothetical protein n=1 Tax=unclassified Deinococcus TaxID=2623546 RepID=UPI001C30E63B|nr:MULTISPECIES: hypothetical protein [unclassified Deinococcus]MDK2010989.1 hypothetical protein [Deinococcus sp. 43]
MTQPNYRKQERYARAFERFDSAMAQGFFIEAAMICESVITDRLHSHVHWRIEVAGTMSRDVVKENKLRGRLDFKGHGNLGLLIRIIELDFDDLQNKNYSGLPTRLDDWRATRNRIAHGITHTSPALKTYADSFDTFIESAEQCARLGRPLLNCLSNWDRSMRRRHVSATKSAKRHVQ